MSTVKLNVARDQLLWSWISNGHGGAGPAQSPLLGRSPAPLAPPYAQALQLSVQLIWLLLPSNILYCSLERKCDVRKKTWALMLALAPAL